VWSGRGRWRVRRVPLQEPAQRLFSDSGAMGNSTPCRNVVGGVHQITPVCCLAQFISGEIETLGSGDGESTPSTLLKFKDHDNQPAPEEDDDHVGIMGEDDNGCEVSAKIIFTKHEGYICSGGDIMVGIMTVAQAKEHAAEIPHCLGFSFQGTREEGPVKVFFKDKWTCHGTGWSSYRRCEVSTRQATGSQIVRKRKSARRGSKLLRLGVSSQPQTLGPDQDSSSSLAQLLQKDEKASSNGSFKAR